MPSHSSQAELLCGNIAVCFNTPGLTRLKDVSLTATSSQRAPAFNCLSACLCFSICLAACRPDTLSDCSSTDCWPVHDALSDSVFVYLACYLSDHRCITIRLSVSLSMTFSLFSVCLVFSLPACLSCLPVCLSVCLSIHLSVSHSVRLSICLSIIWFPTNLSINLVIRQPAPSIWQATAWLQYPVSYRHNHCLPQILL